MRTTLEIPDEQRAKLLQLAAAKGMKGFSSLVTEALTRYLAEEEERRGRIDRALSLQGSLDEEEGEELERSVVAIRGQWR